MHLLEQQLSEIRRRARHVVLTHGVCRGAIAVVGSVFLAAVGDWALHFDDVGIRVILALAIAGCSGWVIYRRLVVPLQTPLRNLDVALRIEERYPGFKDSLASTVQFLEGQADPRIGSPALQRAVIHRTLAQIGGLDFRDVVETREARRWIMAASAVCLTAMLVGGFNLSQTSIALHRLLFPFSAPAWPRATNLRILNSELEPLELTSGEPLQIASGDRLRLYAENTTGRLPLKIQLEYKTDGRVAVESMRPTSLNDAAGTLREVAVGEIPAARRELEFRATGGDHQDMPWFRVLVVPPPVIERLQVTLTSPRYLNRQVEVLPEGVGHVQGYIGTRVDIEATANKPLAAAALRIRDQERRPAAISGEARLVTASFVIAEPGIHSYRLELRDSQGFEDPDPPRYEIRGIQDFEPEVRIEIPAADMQVTQEAEVPIRVAARDDLGLKELRLQFKPDWSDAGTIGLFDGPTRPQQHAADFVWKIAELKPVAGGRIVFHAEATDEFELSPEIGLSNAVAAPHVGRSTSRTLTIVSREDKSNELAQRQANLLNDLQRAYQLQKQASEQVGELRLQLQNAGELRPQDLDTLQRTELGQRDVTGQLTGPATGVIRRAEEILSEMRGNKLNDPEGERRLTGIAEELQRLRDEPLPAIEQGLIQTRKQSQSSTPSGRTPASSRNDQSEPARTPAGDAPGTQQSGQSTSRQKGDNSTQQSDPPPERTERNPSRTGASSANVLRDVAKNQTEVLESLGEMLQQLSQWRNEHDASRELSQVARAQEELNRETAETGRQTLTRSRESLSPQERADLAKLADRQRRNAEQLQQLEQQMRDMAGELARTNPEAAGSLREAAEQMRQEAIAGSMRETSDQIGGNRMGEASQSQQRILEKLRDLEQTLLNRHDNDTEALVKKLKQAEQQLDELRQRQQDLREQLQKAAENPDAAAREDELRQLRNQQQQLREEASGMARQLQKLQARKPGAALQRAASRMEQAENDLQAHDPAEAAADQQEALDDLEQARRELARRRQEAEQQLAHEQLERIADELKDMIGREQAVIDETKRLHELQVAQGRWKREQLLTLRDLADTQRGLKDETDRLVEKLSAAEVFALALKGAARSMQRAGDLLAERDVGLPTQKAEEAARQRFVSLIEALKQDPNEQRAEGENAEEAAGGDNAAGQDQGPPTDGIPTLAQLKMLITLQRELNERTVELFEQRNKSGRLSAADEAELATLAEEQAQLADLVRNLTQPAAAAEPPQVPDDRPTPSQDDPTGRRNTPENKP